jgi:hypothetical protein
MTLLWAAAGPGLVSSAMLSSQCAASLRRAPTLGQTACICEFKRCVVSGGPPEGQGKRWTRPEARDAKLLFAGKDTCRTTFNGVTRQKRLARDHYATWHRGGPGWISDSSGTGELAERYLVPRQGLHPRLRSVKPLRKRAFCSIDSRIDGLALIWQVYVHPRRMFSGALTEFRRIISVRGGRGPGRSSRKNGR